MEQQLLEEGLAPRKVYKYPCGGCGDQVRGNQPAVYCDVCCQWLHSMCLGLSGADYSELQASDESWCCPSCYRSALPFTDCSTLLGVSASSSTPSVLSSHQGAVTSKGLTIYYSNCRSLLPVIDDVADSSHPDIIALTETWLDLDILSSEVATS